MQLGILEHLWGGFEWYIRISISGSHLDKLDRILQSRQLWCWEEVCSVQKLNALQTPLRHQVLDGPVPAASQITSLSEPHSSMISTIREKWILKSVIHNTL